MYGGCSHDLKNTKLYKTFAASAIYAGASLFKPSSQQASQVIFLATNLLYWKYSCFNLSDPSDWKESKCIHEDKNIPDTLGVSIIGQFGGGSVRQDNRQD